MWMLYGLKNCDTCRKAQKKLSEQGIDFVFVDYRERPIASETLLLWKNSLGSWSLLLNKASTTWRNLDESLKNPTTDDEFLNLFSVYPTLLKRPVLDRPGSTLVIGFKSDLWQFVDG